MGVFIYIYIRIHIYQHLYPKVRATQRILVAVPTLGLVQLFCKTGLIVPLYKVSTQNRHHDTQFFNHRHLYFGLWTGHRCSELAGNTHTHTHTHEHQPMTDAGLENSSAPHETRHACATFGTCQWCPRPCAPVQAFTWLSF